MLPLSTSLHGTSTNVHTPTSSLRLQMCSNRGLGFGWFTTSRSRGCDDGESKLGCRTEGVPREGEEGGITCVDPLLLCWISSACSSSLSRCHGGSLISPSPRSPTAHVLCVVPSCVRSDGKVSPIAFLAPVLPSTGSLPVSPVSPEPPEPDIFEPG